MGTEHSSARLQTTSPTSSWRRSSPTVSPSHSGGGRGWGGGGGGEEKPKAKKAKGDTRATEGPNTAPAQAGGGRRPTVPEYAAATSEQRKKWRDEGVEVQI